MKILHVHTADFGGAANAAISLMSGLDQLGHSSKMIVGSKRGSDPRIMEFSKDPHPLLFKFRRWRFNSKGLPDWRFEKRAHEFARSAEFLTADVIHLHNLHGNYFDYRVLPLLSAKKPVVWSLHDMWALTGWCAYFYDCMKWKSGCGECPQFIDRDRKEPAPVGSDNTALNWREKKKAFSSSTVILAVGCESHAVLCKESPLTSALKVVTVPYGLDTSVFLPGERSTACAKLKLDPAKRYLLAFPSPGRKGLDILNRVLMNATLPKNVSLIVVGGYKMPEELSSKLEVIHAGYISDDALLNQYYVAADLFLMPTRADDVPLSLVASMLSGTPAVSFSLGGIPTIVDHMKSGYLARPLDEEDFRSGVELLMRDDALRSSCAVEARAHGLKNFDVVNSAKKYAELYENAIIQY